MLQEAVKEFKNVAITDFSGLLVDFTCRVGGSVIIRGIRAVSDYEYELQMALMNRRLSQSIETVFMIKFSLPYGMWFVNLLYPFNLINLINSIILDPAPTLGFSRVMERAIMHAISSEAAQVDSGAVLAALLQEKESHAAYFLQKHGVSRLPLLKFLAHGGTAPGPAAPEPHAAPQEEGEEPPAKDPLKAYAVDLVQKASEGRIDRSVP